MMPHCKSEAQHELFESAAHGATRPPKLALPFQLSAVIDVARLRTILGVGGNTARRMMRAGLFRTHDSISGWRIEYNSVVEYCEHLRLEYCISDRAVPRPRHGRLRDRDLLPFQLSETIYVKEVTARLDCSIGAVIKLIEEGVLIAYQVSKGSTCPWRIYGPSLERYLQSMHAAAAAPSLQRSAPRR